MSKIDFVLYDGRQDTEGHGSTVKETDNFSVQPQSRNRAAQGAEKLAKAWPTVLEKLAPILDSKVKTNDANGLELDTIEVHLGIEGGFEIGFSAKANADITLTFKKRA